MEKEIEFKHRENYLEVIFKGERTFEVVDHLIERIYNKCQKDNVDKLFVDVREAKGEWKEYDRFRIGARLSDFFKFNYKIVVCDKKEKINKFGENTAVNRGVDILITDDRHKGLEWLLK